MRGRAASSPSAEPCLGGLRSADAERCIQREQLRAYKLLAEPRVAQDLLKAPFYYESQREGLGDEFLAEVSATYDRIQDNPLKYQVLRSEVRRALCRRFPFGVFFSVDVELVSVLAVLHIAKNPEEWKRL